MKTYRSIDDLILELRNKGLIINNEDYAKDMLKKYGYYSIINSYKDIFKNKNGLYKKGVTFEEIVALFEFDFNIRQICIKYIFKIELIMKTQISELLCKNFGLINYLNNSNFDSSINKTAIQNTIDIINEEINKQKDNHEAINHYHYTYGFIPPFVLIKILTLGQINKLYKILKQQDRQNISKNFGLSDNALRQVMQNIIMVRNICCHNERFFSFHSKFTLPLNVINNTSKLSNNSTNVYTIIKAIQHILKIDELEYLIYEEIFKLKEKLKSVDIKLTLNLMGIPKNLKKYVICDIDTKGKISFYNKFLFRNKKLTIKKQIQILSEYIRESYCITEKEFLNFVKKC